MKGFTLIELLAVIVILTIILLISVPIVGNVIDSSKKSAFESSVYGLVEGAKLELMKDSLGGTNADKAIVVEDSLITTGTLEYSGELPENGTIYVKNDGRVAYAMHNGKYCMEKGYGTEVLVSAKELIDCVVPIGPPIITYEPNGGEANPIETVVNVVAMDNPVTTIEYKWTTTVDVPVDGYTVYTNGTTLSNTTVGLYYLHIKVTDSENNITNTVSNLFDVVVPGPVPLTTVVPATYIPIKYASEFALIGKDAAYPNNGKYFLLRNLDMTEITNYAGIGTFSGIIDGNGLYIHNITIDKPTTYKVGFIGSCNSCTIKKVIINNASITGLGSTGGIVGEGNGTITINRVSIKNSFVKGSSSYIGGIIGLAPQITGQVLNLTESTVENTIIEAYSAHRVGGLVGRGNPDTASTNVRNNYVLGGEIKVTTNQDTYGAYVGGLAGDNANSNFINNYATIKIPPRNAYTNYRGGLTGWNNIAPNGNYWDKDTSTQLYNYNTTTGSKTTVQMKQQATFVGWDFTTIWTIDEGNDYPRLRWER